eukprot:TRINITY_DN70580_c0_g1_i1.p1 TRINITY_DN70580_c0_g1~~TRINITY_DN70580_c0_g1_i1.p1  ORF type:complete len:545 (-),score=93.51 TRINITY_DN70580_c0_g1_i1:46-1680(-)
MGKIARTNASHGPALGEVGVRALKKAYEEVEIDCFLTTVSSMLAAHTFPQIGATLAAVGASVASTVTPSGVEDEGLKFGRFVLACLTKNVPPPKHWPPALPHLLSGVGPCSTSNDQAALSAIAIDAATEIAQRGGKTAGRLVNQIFSAWGVRDEDLSQRTQIEDEASETPAETKVQSLFGDFVRQLADAEDWVPAVRLLRNFSSLRAVANVDELLAKLATDSKHDTIALELVSSLGDSYKVALVQHYNKGRLLKSAAHAVKALGLEAQFPNAQLTWKTSSLMGALKKGNWKAAVGISTDEPRLHSRCAQGLIKLGEVELALDLAKAWCVQLESVPSDADLDKRRREREDKYLQPPSALEIHFVSAETDLAAMLSGLKGCSTIGFDVEWRPAPDSPPSLLQISGKDRAYIVDLLSLGGSSELNACLHALFSDKAVRKLGFDCCGDFTRISSAYPVLQAVLSGRDSLEDVGNMYGEYSVQQGTATSKKKAMVSLAVMTETLLGKPLDKTMQLSDWSHRPLSDAQSHYAALDAWVLVELCDRMSPSN